MNGTTTSSSMNVYPISELRPGRLLCVFAHPDDEVFCAGGTLARWVADGGEAMVLSATRGEAGQIQDADAATRRTLGAVRERELRDACAALGVQRVECLDYQDGTLREVDAATLAGDVAARMRMFRPDAVVTFGPDGGYGHPDHIAISDATTRACRQIAGLGGRAPQLYYSAFPCQHRLLCGWLANWLSERRSGFRGSPAMVRALALLADEATMLRYADDAVETQWFPAGFAVVEQGEPGSSLYLIISGHARMVREIGDGSQHVLRTLGPGEFFGQVALARGTGHEASVVASETLTCLVLSSRAPVAFAGRGEQAYLSGALVGADDEDDERASLLYVETDDLMDRKIAALAAHRSQFAVAPGLLPTALLGELLGGEYFVSVGWSPWSKGLDVLASGDAARAMERTPIAIPA